MLEAESVSKCYTTGDSEVAALSSVSLSFEEGKTYALMGPSGSGKSTLLSLLAGLDRPTSGEIRFGDFRLSNSTEEAMTRFRSQNIGFIFQLYYLIPSLTALENVMLPAELLGSGESGSEIRKRAEDLLSRVGVVNRKDHYPSQLSGGEQQRVAIARAYINHPKLLLGDEPTGSLDGENSRVVEDLLFSLNREFGSTLILATHNEELARRVDYTVRLKNGRVV